MKSSENANSITVLGVDPGSLFAGFGVVRFAADLRDELVHFVSFGVIAPPSGLSFAERIAVVSLEFEGLLERVQPNVTVIEKVFLGKNADSAFKLGHARGVMVAAAVRSGSELVEYSTREVKKGITGSGGASKEQVQITLSRLLGIRHDVRADASDALALAYHHVRKVQTRGRCTPVDRPVER